MNVVMLRYWAIAGVVGVMLNCLSCVELCELLSLAVMEHWVLVVSRSLELSEKVKNCCWCVGSDYSGTEGHTNLLLPKLISCMLIQEKMCPFQYI